MDASAVSPALHKPHSSSNVGPPGQSGPPTSTNKIETEQQQQQKKKKKKKPAVISRPPAVKPKNVRVGGAGGKIGGKKSSHGAEFFPIPLTFLYRDPRPNVGRRNAGGVSSGVAPGAGGMDYGGGGSSGDQWTDTDGDGLPIKETAEQVREKKTLYSANMAQAQAFLNNYRFTDARSALNKVSHNKSYSIPS